MNSTDYYSADIGDWINKLTQDTVKASVIFFTNDKNYSLCLNNALPADFLPIYKAFSYSLTTRNYWPC